MEIEFDRKKELGKGSYGIVFRGSWDGEDVAVKRIQKNNYSDSREWNVLKQLSHPNVIKLIHAESDVDFRYYALELCETSLDRLFLKDGDPKIYMGPIPSPENALLQMATGLAYIHSMNFIHRDVKPQNVLISSTNDIVSMKWADFGISKAVNEKGTSSGVGGTKRWLAPELLNIMNSRETTASRHEMSNVKSDVFAEGLLFGYFLLDGKHPFGYDRPEISENVSGNNPVNIEGIPSSEAKNLIFKMLEPNPEKRISSSEVVEELKRIKEQLKNDLKNLDSMVVPSVEQVDKRLGEGGNGSVWEGVWRGQKVAIKKIKLKDELTNEREKSLLKLNHPNVIKMYRIENDSNYRYFALELCVASLDKLFLKGDDLKNYKGPKLPPMPPPQEIFCQLAEGLAYIHEKGLAHRDIKPLNVLIYVRNRSDSSCPVIMKWADFGGSKTVNIKGECSMSSKFKFTEKWCAPELLKFYYDKNESDENKAKYLSTASADVFSEGLIFSWYLLKGEHPYGKKWSITNNLMTNNRINFDVDKIPKEHQKLKEVTEKMLQTEPTKRPSSKDVAEELKRIASSINVEQSVRCIGLDAALDAALDASNSSSSSIKTQKFELDRETILGLGPFGMVFRGNYSNAVALVMVPVAIKRIQLEDIRQNLRYESLVMKLNHQNLVKIYHLEDGTDFKYIVMELCDASLNRLFLPNDHPLKYIGTKPNCFDVIHQLALGLDYIHSQNVIYRVIKPENVLLSLDIIGKKLTMKWGDFGFTKLNTKRGSYSISGMQIREDWLAPELLESDDKEETKESDVFAEGILFGYFLLEGQHPFGSGPYSLHNIIKNNPIEIDQIKSIYLRGLILKMLEPDPMNRITSSKVVELIKSEKEKLEGRLLAILKETPLNLAEMENVMREGVNINCVTLDGLTPLLYLIQNCDDDLLEVTQLLIRYGIDVNHKDDDGWNALYFLCNLYKKNNLSKILELFMQQNIDVNCKNKDGDNILHFFCKNYRGDEFIDIVKILIDSKVDVILGIVDARNLIQNKKYFVAKKLKRNEGDEIIKIMNKKFK